MSALGRRAARAAPESSTLKLEDREAKGGRGRAAAEAGNVVRLPREWLGPPEELIPFGPSAGATAEERSDPPRQEAAGPFPDFWGEESAVLQDVIEAQAEPDVVQTPEAVEGSSRAHAASPIGAEENASTQLPADHPPPQPAARQHAKPGPWWQASLTTTRRTRIVAVAALLLFAIAGTVVLASHGSRPAARISAWSSSADSFGRSLPKAVAAAQARLTRAETNLTRATRHLAAQHRRGPAQPPADRRVRQGLGDRHSQQHRAGVERRRESARRAFTRTSYDHVARQIPAFPEGLRRGRDSDQRARFLPACGVL